ncbi:MAG: hypothetical protein M1838_002127 [Thelocarpon superellum]|nr:MAG: hypothetical protein M1838_002127 [Thelocarpon superellum]
MPGRPSTRSSRPSRASSPRKSSARTITSRASTASRISSPRLDIPDEAPWSSVRAPVCAIFAGAQSSNAGHRKLVINLRKIQARCCNPKPSTPDEEDDHTEHTFNVEVGRCVLRFMNVKKSESVGDRVVRFLGLFLKHASEKDAQLLPETAADETLLETPTSRLTSHILSLLLPLLSAKEKTVRFRSTQLISHIINSLDSIDDDLFQLLRVGLLKRIRDKESMVRVQAVLGLGRLAGNETEGDAQELDSDDDDDAGGLMDTLLEALQNDPSADVRRSLLLNLPLTPNTLPYLLERARDQDAATRRTLYSRLLPALGDFRHLSLSMREKLLRWGLRDRDENVRKAAAKLFRERWIEDCAGPRDPGDGAQDKAAPPNFDGLLELLERIDVVNAGVENGIALEAMKEFWEGRPDYREAFVLDDGFWDGLTAESVFMARTFNDFCRRAAGGKLEGLLEEKMPEVTKFAFYLQRYTNTLVDHLKRLAAHEEGVEEDQTVEQEFIVEQLLHMAHTLDYTDEVGRRKMFSLMRETLAIAELPEEVTKLVVEVLRGLCGAEAAGEREFCGVVLEAVAEVHDTILGDEHDQSGTTDDDSFHSARSEVSGDGPAKSKKNKAGSEGVDDEEEGAKAIREIMVNMKCLHIAQCMLENVEGYLQANVHLVTMLNNLVVPAVRSHEAPIRERGLLCLGLCCLLDKTLAEENLTLFLHCFNKGHDALQVYALHILSDILTTHGPALLESEVFEKGKPLYKIFSKALRAEDKPAVQAAACTAVCKLMLGCVIKDEDLLKLLVVAYFDPATASNLGLRQCLSYFLPVYCHSRRENQGRMQRVTVAAIHSLILVSEHVDEEEEMVALSVIASHLVDWTDPRKLVVAASASGSGGAAAAAESIFDEMGRKENKAVNGDVHLDLAGDILERISASNCHKEEKKILASMLSKLYITSNAEGEKKRRALDLARYAVDDGVFADAPSRNALNKLLGALEKVGADVVKEEEEAGTPGVETPGAEDTMRDDDDDAVTVRGEGEGEKTEMASMVDNDEEETMFTKLEEVEEEGMEELEELEELKGEEGDTTTSIQLPKARAGHGGPNSARALGTGAARGDSLLDALLDDEEEDEVELSI